MASTSATKKAGLFQTLDLGLEPFIDHRQLADFGLDLEVLIVPVIGLAALEGSQTAEFERLAPGAEGGRGHAQFSRDQFKVFTADQSQDSLQFAPRRIGRRCAAPPRGDPLAPCISLLTWAPSFLLPYLLPQFGVQENSSAGDRCVSLSGPGYPNSVSKITLGWRNR